MAHVLLPEHEATPSTGVVNPEEQQPKEEKDVASVVAELEAQADAEAAANKAANENPKLTEEEADIIGKKHVEKALSKEKDEGTKKVAGDVVEEGEKYVPNFKYKVLDQEKEIPEWARGVVTKDNEAQIREVFEKADGLDHVKAKLGEERQVRESLDMNFGAVKSEIQNLVGWRDKNLGIFFEKVGLPKNKVAQWLLQEIEKEELPEPVRKMYNDHEAQQRRLAELEQENLQLSGTREVDMVQARTNELNQVLSAPEVAPLVSAFDARVGQPGSFMQMVTRHGQAEWEASGKTKDLTPKEAVDQVLKILNLQSQTPSPVVTPNETPSKTSSTTQKVVKQAKPVVLPNVGGGGAAPASKRVKSVDDIRKVYREMSGQN